MVERERSVLMNESVVLKKRNNTEDFMKLKEFVIKNKCDFASDAKLVSENFLKKIEQELGVVFGPQMKTYILKYGYLGYSHRELFGINNIQQLQSDMCKQTIFMHEKYPQTQKMILLEKPDKTIFVIADYNDNIYIFDSKKDNLKKTEQDVNTYIIESFSEIIKKI